MNNLHNSSPDVVLRKRYLRILRQTIRQQLELELDDHLKHDDNFKHYLSSLCLPQSCDPSADGIKKAMAAVDQSPPICDWFNLKEFWKEQFRRFRLREERKGPTAYVNVLRRLMVRLHGFWVFTLDDTNHTFRFVRAPAQYDEWGPDPKSTKQAEAGKADDPDKWPAIHFGGGVFYRRGTSEGSDDLKNILQSSLKQYLLRPGEGSVGLGLRADRGVCLRDTVRDLRGAVALEDCITRNLSYIGLPIFLAEGGNNFELGARGRPIGHFGIFFPAPIGWHTRLKSGPDWCKHCMFPCGAEKPKDDICLFQRMLNLRRDFIQPLVAQNYQTLSSRRFRLRVRQIAELGADPEFQNRGVDPAKRREVFLKKILPEDSECESDNGKGDDTLKIEDFQSVQIWERHMAIAGLSDGTIPMSEASTTWRQSVRWKYPDLFFAHLRQTVTDFQLTQGEKGPWCNRKNGPWQTLKESKFTLDSQQLGPRHQILIIGKPATDDEPTPTSFNQNALQAFWESALKLIDNTHPPDCLPEFRGNTDPGTIRDQTVSEKLNKQVRDQKWGRLLRSHIAQCLASRLLYPNEEAMNLSPLLFPPGESRTELKASLDRIERIYNALSVSILGGAPYRFFDSGPRDSIKVSKGLKPLQERFLFELRNVGHTMRVLLSLTLAAEKAGLLDGSTPLFLSNHDPSAVQGKDWPIQSEAYHLRNTHEVDCGTETAFAIPAIWDAWCKMFASDHPKLSKIRCLDRIILAKKPDGIRVTLRSSTKLREYLSFSLVENKEACKVFQGVLVHDAKPLKALLMKDRSAALEGGMSRVLRREGENKFSEACDAANQVRNFLARCRKCDGCKPDQEAQPKKPSFCILLARVGGEWQLKQRSLNDDEQTAETFPSDSSGSCIKVTLQERRAFEQVASSAQADDHPLGHEYGLSAHVFVPLSRPVEDQYADPDVGFLLFSGSQAEHDTIRRVDIRPAQQALVSFATDYLEYAIAQELQQVRQIASLQRIAHSLSQDSAFYQSAAAAKPHYAALMDIGGHSNDPNEAARTFANLAASGKITTKLADQLFDLLLNCDFLLKADLQSFVFATTVECLKQTLVGRPENKYPTPKPAAALNLRTWIEHLQVRIQENEGARDKPTAFKFDNPQLNGSEVESLLPFGSICVLLDELARNAAKHRRENTIPIVKLNYEQSSRSLSIIVTNEISSKPADESTGGGIPILRNLLSANFGTTSLRHCGPEKSSQNIWCVEVCLDFRIFERRSQS